MDHNDFVFSKGGDGKIYGGGFCIDNILSKSGGGSPLITLNNNDDINDINNNQIGGGNSSKIEQFSDIFKNYAVPSGLFSFPYKSRGFSSINNRANDDNDDLINDELYSKLLDLVNEKNIKGGGKKTRRTKIKINKSKKGTQRALI
jgi:hypothetical protein